MNRLERKCIIASAGLHVSLAVILLVGPGFLAGRSKPDLTPPMDFISAKTVDEALSGGGDNTVKAPPAALVAPPVAPAPAPVTPTPPVVEKAPTPVVDNTPPTPAPKTPPKEVKPPKNDDLPTDVKPRATHQIVVNTKPVTTSATDAKAAKEAQAKAAAAAARRQAAAVSRAIAGIQGGVSGSTEIRLAGPGGGGVPYGNFLAAVKKVYWENWIVPEGVPDSIVRVSVTIARDGTVITSRITDESGNSAVDNSVQKTLDRVKYAAPLPDGAKEDQRTVTISFNTEAKLAG